MCDGGEDPSWLGPVCDCMGCEKSPGVVRKLCFRAERVVMLSQQLYQKREKAHSPTFDRPALRWVKPPVVDSLSGDV